MFSMRRYDDSKNGLHDWTFKDRAQLGRGSQGGVGDECD